MHRRSWILIAAAALVAGGGIYWRLADRAGKPGTPAVEARARPSKAQRQELAHDFPVNLEVFRADFSDAKNRDKAADRLFGKLVLADPDAFLALVNALQDEEQKTYLKSWMMYFLSRNDEELFVQQIPKVTLPLPQHLERIVATLPSSSPAFLALVKGFGHNGEGQVIRLLTARVGNDLKANREVGRFPGEYLTGDMETNRRLLGDMYSTLGPKTPQNVLEWADGYASKGLSGSLPGLLHGYGRDNARNALELINQSEGVSNEVKGPLLAGLAMSYPQKAFDYVASSPDASWPTDQMMTTWLGADQSRALNWAESQCPPELQVKTLSAVAEWLKKRNDPRAEEWQAKVDELTRDGN